MKAVKDFISCPRSHKHYNGRCQTKALVPDYLCFVLYQCDISMWLNLNKLIYIQTEISPNLKIPFYSCMATGMTLISVYSFEKRKKITIS